MIRLAHARSLREFLAEISLWISWLFSRGFSGRVSHRLSLRVAQRQKRQTAVNNTSHKHWPLISAGCCWACRLGFAACACMTKPCEDLEFDTSREACVTSQETFQGQCMVEGSGQSLQKAWPVASINGHLWCTLTLTFASHSSVQKACGGYVACACRASMDDVCVSPDVCMSWHAWVSVLGVVPHR